MKIGEQFGGHGSRSGSGSGSATVMVARQRRKHLFYLRVYVLGVRYVTIQ